MKIAPTLLCGALLACGGSVVEPGRSAQPTPAGAPGDSRPTGPGSDAGSVLPPGPGPEPTAPIVESDAGSPVASPPPSVPNESDAGSPVASPPPSVPNEGDTIAFAPTKVDVERFPAGCGVPNPPFMNGDLFSMDIIGNMAAAPYDALEISFPTPATVSVPVMPAVQPFTQDGTGIGLADGGTQWHAAQNAQGSGINFNYAQGSDPSEIDTGAFDAVTITILAMPTKDGDPLTIRLQIHFVDGRVLDETFSGPLFSSWSGCPEG